MQKSYLYGIVGAVVALVSFQLLRPVPVESAAPTVAVATTPLTTTTLTTTSQQKIALAEWKDRRIVLHFWGAWCGPCVRELPQIMRLAKANPDWQFVMVGTDKQQMKMDNFLTTVEARTQVAFRLLPNVHIVWDGDRYISESLYGVKNYPTSLMVVPPLALRFTLEGAGLRQSHLR